MVIINQFFLMLRKKFSEHTNYFDSSEEEIAKQNIKMLKACSILSFLFILLFITITPLFFPRWTVAPCYWAFFLISLIFVIASQMLSYGRVRTNSVKILCIAFCTTILFFSVIIDAIVNPQATANFFPLLFVILPVIFIIKYYHIVVMNILFEILFVILVSITETGSIRQNDIFNSLISFLLSITASLIVISLRVDDNTAKQRYKKLSKIDYLTSIYNKNTCESAVSNFFANRPQNSICALIIMDIDNFKNVNDEYGHTMGDRILEDFSRCLLEVFDNKNIVGRIGGDEFMVLFSDISEESIVSIKCRDLQNRLKKINYIDDYVVQCSIGAAIVRNHKCGYFQMFKLADDALYEAKNSGKNRFVLKYFSNDQNICEIKPSFALIDSDDIERVAIHNALCRHYEIKEAQNDNDAINALEYLKDRLSGVILDFYSGKISSYAIMKYIKNNFVASDIPIIAIIPNDFNGEQILKQGICEVIKRPVDESALIERIQNIVINKMRK